MEYKDNHDSDINTTPKVKMFTVDEVRELLDIQRGNCYVAVLTQTGDKETAMLCIKAPEPAKLK
jgi:ribosome-binding factor A